MAQANQTLILQIGGWFLDYRSATFEIDGRSYGPLKLASQALAQHYSGRALLLFPESLAAKLARDPSELAALLRDRDRLKDSLRQNLRMAIPGSEGLDLEVIPSSGTYIAGNLRLSIMGSLKWAEMALFTILMRYAGEVQRIILDVSTGLNVYPVLALRALLNYIVYRKLGNYLQILRSGDRGPLSCYLAFYPQPSEGAQVRVELEPVDTTAHHTFPLTRTQIETLRLEELELSALRDESKLLKSIIANGLFYFNCLRFNTPLLLCDGRVAGGHALTEIKRVEDRLLEETERLWQSSEPSSNQGPLEISRPEIDFRLLRNIFLALALTRSLTGLVDECRRYETEDQGFPVEVLEEKFLKIYKSSDWLIANERLLSLDLQDVKRLAGNIAEADLEKWVPLHTLATTISRPSPEQEKVVSDLKRNFLVHSGLLYRSVEVMKKSDGSLYIRYSNPRELRAFRKWVLEPS